jgi:hypothetical protein
VGPSSLSGNSDHDRYTRDKIAYPPNGVEIGKTVAEGGDGDEVEELDITTIDGHIVVGATSGSPIECTMRANPTGKSR